MKCHIVKDLLPNYIDGLTDKDINTEIEAHLKECNHCRILYEHMLSSTIPEAPPNDTDIDFLKKLKSLMHRKYVTVIFLTCSILIGFMLFITNYDIPVPYEKVHMTIETYQAVKITNSYGNVQWDDVDLLDFETTKAVIAKAYDPIDLIRLVRKEAPADESFESCGRTIYRNGQKIRVVYCCCTKTLWNKLFLHNREDLSTLITTAAIYGQSLYQEKYEPQLREIYYLPMRNLNSLEKLSDDEFDAQKENAILVWDGIV